MVYYRLTSQIPRELAALNFTDLFQSSDSSCSEKLIVARVFKCLFLCSKPVLDLCVRAEVMRSLMDSDSGQLSAQDTERLRPCGCMCKHTHTAQYNTNTTTTHHSDQYSDHHTQTHTQPTQTSADVDKRIIFTHHFNEACNFSTQHTIANNNTKQMFHTQIHTKIATVWL